MKTTRRVVQFGFLALTLVGVFVYRGNAERWCPFGGLEALYTYAAEGNLICSLAVSNFYILGGVIVMTLLLRRVFCGYMCPVGTISEWLQQWAGTLSRMLRRVWRGLPARASTGWKPVPGKKEIPPQQTARIRSIATPYALDRGLSVLKYLVLGVVLYFTYKTSELVLRGYDPCYALISRHGEDITVWAYVIAGVVVIGSLVITLPFCRWLCPLAAVLNPFSRFALTRVKRDGDICLDCGQCVTACPMAIPLDQAEQVTVSRCLSCLSCVDECSARGSGAMSWGPPAWMGGRWSNVTLVAVLLSCTTAAVAASHWFPMPSFRKTRGEEPQVTATMELEITGLNCRGNANLLMYFLERDDEFELRGYLSLEAWPQPGIARAQVTHDPSVCNESAVRRAITEPYYDAVGALWRFSPFEIEGYDPLESDEGDEKRSLPSD